MIEMAIIGVIISVIVFASVVAHVILTLHRRVCALERFVSDTPIAARESATVEQWRQEMAKLKPGTPRWTAYANRLRAKGLPVGN